MSGFSDWLDQPETWEKVAELIGTYDLADTRTDLDVVQTVLTAAARAARSEESEAIAIVERWMAMVKGSYEGPVEPLS